MEITRWLRTQWDRVLAAVVGTAGLILIALGWAGVSRSKLVTQQIPYLASGGLFGIFFLGLSATLWLSADLRDEWRKLDDIHRALRSTDDAGRWTDTASDATREDVREEPSTTNVAPPRHVTPPRRPAARPGDR